MIKVSLKEILKSDVGILNKYFLVTLILVLLTVVGYTSYALFSYEEVSTTGIRLKYTGETLPTSNLSRLWKNKTNNELNYSAIYTLDNVNFPSTYSYNETTYTLTTTIDVSEQENGNVLLAEYKNGSNYIAIFGQDGGVIAPVDSSDLFSLWYEGSRTKAPEGYLYNDVEYIDLTNLNTKNTANMKNMFGINNPNAECSSYLNTIVFGKNFITSKVMNMEAMFMQCDDLTFLDVSNFDTSKVTNMSYMFSHCSSLTSITVGCNWKTDNVITMEAMFSGSTISEVIKVCNGTTDELSPYWWIKTTKEASYLALYTYNSKTLPNTYSYNETTYTLNTTIDVSETQNSSVMLGEYKNGSNIIAIIGQDGGVVAPNGAQYLFYGCSKLVNLDLNGLDTSKVTNMSGIFYSCSSLTSLDLSNFDTSNVINMSYMFAFCSSLTSLNLSDFNTSKVTNMQNMFYYCKNLINLNVSNLDTKKVTNMNYMFYNCSSLTSLDLSNFDTSNIINMSYMFYSCSSLTSLNLSDFNTSKVTNMNYMFNNCSSLTSIDLSKFNTSNVTSMYGMFSDCRSLTDLDLTSFDTRNVTNMNYMFSYCSSLTSLDLTTFDTRNVTNMMSMFYKCSSLTIVKVGCNFVIGESTTTTDMFTSAGTSSVTKVCDE